MPERFQSPVKISPTTGKPISLTVDRQQGYILEKCRKDPVTLARFLFGNKPAPHHLVWFNAMKNDSRFCIIAFPGSGKTYSVEAQMLWEIGNFPHRTNMISSVTADQANSRLKMIRETIAFDERYKAVFPWIERDFTRAWTDSELNVIDNRVSKSVFMSRKHKDGTANTATLTAFGAGSAALIGNRFSGFVIVDDPHDEKAAYSPTIRARTIDWFIRTLASRLLDTAKVGVISTRWHENDLPGYIRNNMPTYKVYETPAMEENSDGILVPVWKDVWWLEKLQLKELEIGTAMFRAMYLNDPNALSGSMFSIDWMQEKLPSPLPEFERVIISVDPATTTKSTSDFTAMAVMAIDATHRVYILDMINRKLTPAEWVPFLNSLAKETQHKYGRMDSIVIEKTGQQAFIVDSAQQQLFLPIYGFNRKGNKRQKAELLSLKMNQGTVCVDWDTPWGGELKGQLLSFPDSGKHDDMVDAAAQGVNYFSTSDEMITATIIDDEWENRNNGEKPLETPLDEANLIAEYMRRRIDMDFPEGFTVRI